VPRIIYVVLTIPGDATAVIQVVAAEVPTPVELLFVQHLCLPVLYVNNLSDLFHIPVIAQTSFNLPGRQDDAVLKAAHIPHFSIPILLH